MATTAYKVIERKHLRCGVQSDCLNDAFGNNVHAYAIPCSIGALNWESTSAVYVQYEFKIMYTCRLVELPYLEYYASALSMHSVLVRWENLAREFQIRLQIRDNSQLHSASCAQIQQMAKVLAFSDGFQITIGTIRDKLRHIRRKSSKFIAVELHRQEKSRRNATRSWSWFHFPLQLRFPIFFHKFTHNSISSCLKLLNN